MSRDLSRYFSCETYLLAFAGGSRDGFVREHIDNCSFCEALVYGGTEEFPLSFDEEVAQVRAERERARKAEGRRRFLKIGAAVVLGLATIGTTGVIASKFANQRHVAVLRARKSSSLTTIYQQHGRAGIEGVLARANSYETTLVYKWIGDQRHTSLLDVLLDGVGSSNLDERSAAVQQLKRFNPSTLSSSKNHLIYLTNAESDADLRWAMNQLVNTIP